MGATHGFRTLAVMAAVAIILSASAVAQEPLGEAEMQTLLMEANAVFREANGLSAADPGKAKELYGKSILRFERILRDGGVRNGKLYYNLGNAYFLKGDMGRAVLNYRRALRYVPNDANLRQNLAYARNQRTDRIEEPQKTKVLKTLFFWHYDLATKTRLVLFVTCFFLLWIAASVRLFVRRPGLGWAMGVCSVLSALLVASLTVEALAHAQDSSGVVIAAEVTARKGNGESYQPSFEEPLHGGTEFSLLEGRGDWFHVELGDGRQCWVPADSAELLREAAPQGPLTRSKSR